MRRSLFEIRLAFCRQGSVLGVLGLTGTLCSRHYHYSLQTYKYVAGKTDHVWQNSEVFRLRHWLPPTILLLRLLMPSTSQSSRAHLFPCFQRRADNSFQRRADNSLAGLCNDNLRGLSTRSYLKRGLLLHGRTEPFFVVVSRCSRILTQT